MDFSIPAAQLESHLKCLCEDIGTRVAGTPAEGAGGRIHHQSVPGTGPGHGDQEFPCVT